MAGVIAHGPQKKLFYVPSDRYKVLPEDSVVSPKLVAIQSALLDGTFRITHMSQCSKPTASTTLGALVPG